MYWTLNTTQEAVGDSKISGTEAIERTREGIFVDSRQPESPWFDLTALSEELRRPLHEAESAVQQTIR